MAATRKKQRYHLARIAFFSLGIILFMIFEFLIVIQQDKHQLFQDIRKQDTPLSYSIPFSRQLIYKSEEFSDFMKIAQQQQVEFVKLIREEEISELPNVVIVSQLMDEENLFLLDLLTSIQMNLLNPSVAEYHLLQIDNSLDSEVMSLLFANVKIKIHRIGEKINRAIFLKYCNEYLKEDRRVLFLNQPDVYFDNTLILASKVEYGEYVKIHKRLNMVKPFKCENGQGSMAEGILFRTNSKEPFMVNEGDFDWTRQLIIPMTAKIFHTHNCELAEQINGWFLSEPSTLVYSNMLLLPTQPIRISKREKAKKE